MLRAQLRGTRCYVELLAAQTGPLNWLCPEATIPFWPLVFKNVRVFFLGSDDFPLEAKREAAHDLTAAVQGGWVGLPVGVRFSLAELAEAHACIEERRGPGRVVVTMQG